MDNKVKVFKAGIGENDEEVYSDGNKLYSYDGMGFVLYRGELKLKLDNTKSVEEDKDSPINLKKDIQKMWDAILFKMCDRNFTKIPPEIIDIITKHEIM